MEGRKPKPTNLKILEGNPGKRLLNLNEPRPELTKPHCPTWLRLEAKREWRRIAPQLEKIGLLSKLDRVALAGYCQTYAKWRQAEEFIEKHGFSLTIPKKDEEGRVISMYIQQYPQVSIAKQCLDQIKAFCAEFGLTPAERSRLSIGEKDKKDDPMADILNGVRDN